MSDDSRPVDRARVTTLLEQYGADPARFPETERTAATALLQSDPELAALQRQAAELDEMLGAFEPAPPSGELARRVAEIPLRHPQSHASVGWLALLGLGRGGLLRAGLAGALASAMGVALGIASLPVAESGAQAPVTLAAGADDAPETQDDAEDAWDAMSSLAFADDLTLDALDAETEAP